MSSKQPQKQPQKQLQKQPQTNKEKEKEKDNNILNILKNTKEYNNLIEANQRKYKEDIIIHQLGMIFDRLEHIDITLARINTILDKDSRKDIEDIKDLLKDLENG